MKENNGNSIPIGVLLISGFYAFGAIALLVMLIVNPQTTASQIALRHGLPAATGKWILPVVAGIGLLIAFGLISRSRWGFILTIAYLTYFLVVNAYLSGGKWVSVYFGDAIWSFLVIVYLIVVRKYIFAEREAQAMQIEP